MRGLSIIIIGIFFIISCKGQNEKRIEVPKDYRTWKKPFNRVLDYTVPGHGKSFRIIYANDLAYKAVVVKDTNGNDRIQLPDGSIVMKEVYMKRKDINKKEPALTYMVKSRGDEDSLDGWLYYMKKPGMDVKLVKSRMCIGCHEAANESHPYFDENKKGIFRDYLFVNFVK